MTANAILGALMGTAVGDALGMPIEGFSHQNVRTFYKGIKEMRADERRHDLEAGQWTDDTQFTFALARVLTQHPEDPADWPAAAAAQYVALRDEARRWGPTTTAAIDRLADGAAPGDAGDPDGATDGAAMRAAPLGVWWAVRAARRADAWAALRPVLAVTHRHPAALVAGWGQAAAVYRLAAFDDPRAPTIDSFWRPLIEDVVWAEQQLNGDARVSQRLRRLTDVLNDVPLELRDVCDGAGVAADEAWPFAVGMVVRRPHLLENTLLSGINVGGDADTTGAMMGALLGVLHGWAAFPQEWKEALEATGALEEQARAFADAVRA